MSMAFSWEGYDEEAFRVSLDIMQWLAHASALEVAKQNAENW